jgi:hypothetical protein
VVVVVDRVPPHPATTSPSATAQPIGLPITGADVRRALVTCDYGSGLLPLCTTVTVPTLAGLAAGA